jgi:hypothetical protein
VNPSQSVCLTLLRGGREAGGGVLLSRTGLHGPPSTPVEGEAERRGDEVVACRDDHGGYPCCMPYPRPGEEAGCRGGARVQSISAGGEACTQRD